MTTCSLPVLIDGSGSRPKVKVENGIRNVFVTQSDDNSHRQKEHVSQTPAATETSRRLREVGVHTLQRSLVLKKQAEMSEVDKRLALKRQEFKESVEAMAQRRSELEEKQQQTKEKVMKFEKFVAENELKRRQMLKTCEATREQNILKKREIEDLTEQLKQLRARKQVLKERMTKYKIYEDYLMKTLENFPGHYLDNGSESLVMPIIRRHETLSITHQELLQRLGRMEEQVEQGHRLRLLQECILDKADTQRRVRRLMESGSGRSTKSPNQLMKSPTVCLLLKVVNVVEQCQAQQQEDTLLRLFNEPVTSDGLVQYLRLLTSAHLQNHADFFCNFVEAPDLHVYCRQEVEAMAMECDHVDILALTQALDICIHIVSMEGDEQQLAHHIIPEGAEPSLYLLYQTSHYNILYPRPQL